MEKDKSTSNKKEKKFSISLEKYSKHVRNASTAGSPAAAAARSGHRCHRFPANIPGSGKAVRWAMSFPDGSKALFRRQPASPHKRLLHYKLHGVSQAPPAMPDISGEIAGEASSPGTAS